MSQTNVMPAIVHEKRHVDQALSRIGLTRDIVRRIALAAAGARNDAMAVDPSCSPGMLSYIYGVRETRLALLPLGWAISRDGNVELTLNAERDLQVCFQNVDLACGQMDPEAISGKGAASRRLVNSGQAEFEFTGGDSSTSQTAKNSPTIWLICVSADENSIRAEVSCPKIFEGNSFQGFVHRLFVMDESCNPQTNQRDSDDDFELDLDIQVSKKQ